MTTTTGRPAEPAPEIAAVPALPESLPESLPASAATGTAIAASTPGAPALMHPVRRGVQLLLGLVGFGVATAMMLHSGQGAMPWAVLDQGIVDRTGLAYGWVVLGVGLLVMLAWIPLRQKPGIGTIANIIVISLVIDPSLWVLERLLPEPALATGIALALGGTVLLGVSTAAYVGARLGPGPRDGLMTGIVQRTGWPVWMVKTVIEVTVVVVGVLLGGTFGWATVVFAFGVGPVVQVAARWLAPRGLVG
ncbi:YitT family protein [Promicromonospora sp. NPDC060204]|uniref:membrane protein YczE n=1 Tax=Promicromonospora sp. NPDC060204 TaxID=3347071 RepID=UPI0036592F06